MNELIESEDLNRVYFLARSGITHQFSLLCFHFAMRTCDEVLHPYFTGLRTSSGPGPDLLLKVVAEVVAEVACSQCMVVGGVPWSLMQPENIPPRRTCYVPLASERCGPKCLLHCSHFWLDSG